MTHNELWVIDTFLLLYVVLIARSREIRWYQATLISLFRFLLAGTPFSYPVWEIVKILGSLFLADPGKESQRRHRVASPFPQQEKTL
ncbi:hypothetical protein [Streptomyces sp. NPDC054804]